MARALVLIVVEVPAQRAVYNHLLRGTGFRLVFAEHGEDGFDRFQEAEPDAVIVHLHTPRLEGAILCRLIRQDHRGQLPIVLVGDVTGGDAAQRARALGADACLPYPPPREALLAYLRGEQSERGDEPPLADDEQLTHELAGFENAGEDMPTRQTERPAELVGLAEVSILDESVELSDPALTGVPTPPAGLELEETIDPARPAPFADEPVRRGGAAAAPSPIEVTATSAPPEAGRLASHGADGGVLLSEPGIQDLPANGPGGLGGRTLGAGAAGVDDPSMAATLGFGGERGGGLAPSGSRGGVGDESAQLRNSSEASRDPPGSAGPEPRGPRSADPGLDTLGDQVGGPNDDERRPRGVLDEPPLPVQSSETRLLIDDSATSRIELPDLIAELPREISTGAQPRPELGGAPRSRKGLDESQLGRRLVKRVEQVHRLLDDLDYYQLLGVEPDATPEQLRDAYFELSLEFHPDRFFLLRSGEVKQRIYTIFRRVNEAYAVLSEPRRRAPYEAARASHREKRAAPELRELDRPSIAPAAPLPSAPSAMSAPMSSARAPTPVTGPGLAGVLARGLTPPADGPTLNAPVPRAVAGVSGVGLGPRVPAPSVTPLLSGDVHEVALAETDDLKLGARLTSGEAKRYAGLAETALRTERLHDARLYLGFALAHEPANVLLAKVFEEVSRRVPRRQRRA